MEDLEWLAARWAVEVSALLTADGAVYRYGVTLTGHGVRHGWRAESAEAALRMAREWAEAHGAPGGVPREEPDAALPG